MRKCERCGKEIEEWGICSCSGQQEFYYSGNQNPVNEFIGGVQRTEQDTQPFVIDNFSTKNQNNKKVFPILLLLIVGVVGFIAYQFIKDDSYKEPLNQYCAIVSTKDDNLKRLYESILPEYIVDVMNGTIDTFGTNGEILSTLNQASATMNLLYYRLEAMCGSDYTVSCKVKWKKKMSQSELDECKSGINTYYTSTIKPMTDLLNTTNSAELVTYLGGTTQQVDRLRNICNEAAKAHQNIEVSEGYVLTVEFTFKGSKGKEKTKSKINVIKVNGKWTFDFFSPGDGNILSVDNLID